MALDSSAVGRTTEPLEYTYDFRDVVLYALGVGAKRDRDLPFLYEKHGPRVLPTFAVVPAFACLEKVLPFVGGDFRGVVHNKQSLTLHGKLPTHGTLTSVGKVIGVYDMKRFGVCTFGTETRDAAGTLLATTESQILFRFDGGFGGERPPAEPRNKVPEGEPLFSVTETTTQEQALLYRLSGDLNPLHADPELAKEVGFDTPILHGLCTYGIVARAVVEHACGGDEQKLKSIGGQFRRPVFPGEALVVTGFRTDAGLVLRAASAEKPDDYVFTNGYADVEAGS
jgi:acyl dehydratase